MIKIIVLIYLLININIIKLLIYIDDNSVLYNGTEKIEGCIGLDYPCRNPNINSYEKAVKIHN